MRTIRRRFELHLCAILSFALTAAKVRAGYITGAGGLEGLGTFSATVTYFAADPGHATLTIDLWNTSPSANGGYLTAFALHNPFGQITGMAVNSTNPNFGPLGGPSFVGGISASPFEDLDLGASTSNAFLGGGSPVGGIGVGAFSTFVFALTGTDLDDLTIESFFGNPPAGAGGNPEPVAFLARFRGFNNGGSDKVPGVLEFVPPAGVIPSVPEPATLLLGCIGAVAGLSCRWRGRVARRRD